MPNRSPLSLLLVALLCSCTNEPEETARSCAADAECAMYVDTPYCDRSAGRCMAPCTADVVGVYVCMAGEPIYCEDDMALPCTVCTRSCGTDAFCDSTTEACAPRRAVGEPCTNGGECLGSSCTSGGVCGVAQGESCTPETCEGVCADGRDGNTYCIRRCSGSSCSASTAGGYTWHCITFGFDSDSPSYCVPGERCIWESGCGTFEDATCGQACPDTGCFTYCVPNALETE